MLWLALHLPLLSLEACRAPLPPAQRARPVVLLQAHRVSHANAEAAARGVRLGMKRATALALAGDLLVAEADAQRDADALLAVAHAALAYTPSVTRHDGLTVLLEVQASLRLFGGPLPLWRRLLAALAPLGHRVDSAAAPTALGAALLARQVLPPSDAAGDTAPGPWARDTAELQALLDPAPAWLLGPGREHWDALQGMGLHTLADLRGLPRAGLARRFGEGLMDELDRALGRQPDPRRWLHLPAVFDTRLELQARAEHTEQVLAAADVLLARLVAWAQARQARVAAFTLAMLHERQRQAEQPPTTLHIELAEPALDPAHLQLLLRERLGRVVLAAPTLALRLHCSHTVAAPAPNGELFPTRASAAQGLTRLLERLRARLGDAQVQRLLPVPDHRPECAHQAVAATAMAAPGRVGPGGTGDAGGGGLPLHRPAWLLAPPQALAERGGSPVLDGQALQLLSGPERIEAGWWDADAVARDYFIAQAADGSLVWIYRARVPGTGPTAPWFLQGRFA